MNKTERQSLIDLYLEQIKYLTQQNESIQNNFLTNVGLPLVALGVLIYYIEGCIQDKAVSHSLYLLLPFLYLGIPYNLIKYTTRMLTINRYIKHLENNINDLMKGNVFLWYTELINSSIFPGGFATITTLGLIPINIPILIFIGVKYSEALKIETVFSPYYNLFTYCLLSELIIMGLMLLNTVMIHKVVDKKCQIKRVRV